MQHIQVEIVSQLLALHDSLLIANLIEEPSLCHSLHSLDFFVYLRIKLTPTVHVNVIPLNQPVNQSIKLPLLRTVIVK